MTSPGPREVMARIERFPIAGHFTISRGAKTEALSVVTQITRSGLTGRGECVPYARYGETPESVLAAIEAMRSAIEGGIDRETLRRSMAAGAARNALDCALIDLEAKQAGQRAWEVLSLAPPTACTTAYTISLADPASMAEAAGQAAHRALLKIKLGRDGDDARITAVRQAAPRVELIVDANEGWTTANLEENLAACAACGVTLVEQPLPAGRDAALASIRRPVAVCADESVHETSSLAALVGRYDAVNIKLDKSGGLTEALAMVDEAKRLGFDIMVGCMVASSLAMAPAMLLTGNARFVDLDGPLLLSRDRPHGLHYEESLVHPPQAALWG